MRSASWVRQFLAGIVVVLLTLIWALARHHQASADERPADAGAVEAEYAGGTGT